ncbi:MAG: hypothetical protein R2751_16210 [Bacteroidales bacterium]
MAELLLATANGQLILCDTEEVRPKVVFRCREEEALMGLCTDGDHVYVASLDRLFKLRTGDYEVVGRSRRFWPSPDFHQMNLYDGRLYATATKRNEIWTFDTRLRDRKKFRIPPPIPGKPVKYKKNYNHINAVVREGDSFYVNLNWINHVQYGESGVLVASADFRKREVFPYAWESHDFQFIDGKKRPSVPPRVRTRTSGIPFGPDSWWRGSSSGNTIRTNPSAKRSAMTRNTITWEVAGRRNETSARRSPASSTSSAAPTTAW